MLDCVFEPKICPISHFPLVRFISMQLFQTENSLLYIVNILQRATPGLFIKGGKKHK